MSVYFSGQIMSADKYTSIIFVPAEDYSASSKTSRFSCLGMPLFSFLKFSWQFEIHVYLFKKYVSVFVERKFHNM